MKDDFSRIWTPGVAPVAVVMISLNEGHNMEKVLENLSGWAQEVFLVDSFSKDHTVDVALGYGVHVVQRRFRGFGDQWNFALDELPLTAQWTMKLDPDERLSSDLKENLNVTMRRTQAQGISLSRRLWLMGRPLSVRQKLTRLWRTGTCRFSDVAVNEHPLVRGHVEHVQGELEHHDSPDLHHWLEKQNRYTTAEAIRAFRGDALAEDPRLLGTSLQRRMWLKENFRYVPWRYNFLFCYHLLWQGAWRAGRVGLAWSRLRCDVMRIREYKEMEMRITGRIPETRAFGAGIPDPRVRRYD